MADKNYIVEEIHGDTLTPIAIYQRLSGTKKFLLESSYKHEDAGRYSFIGANPSFEIKGEVGKTTIISKNGISVLKEKPLGVLKKLLPISSPPNEERFPFIGGGVGIVGYDAVRHYVDIGEMLEDELNIPDFHLLFFEVIVVFDHLEEKVYLVGIPLRKETTVNELKEKIAFCKQEIEAGKGEEFHSVTISSYEPSIEKEKFIEMVEKAKERMKKEGIHQVVLSQRMKAKFVGEPFSFYRKLRNQHPSPYMFYLDFDDYFIAGASPESLIKVKGNDVTTNPIAGTRPRGKTIEEDMCLEEDLLQDKKEVEEHKMLVDLSFDDLTKVSEEGSIITEKYMEVEKYKHVMHIVSVLRGTLKKEKSPIDALMATLPAGTVSGTPKVHAMEMINDLEEIKRGPYAGAIGYMSANGNIDFAIAIRTMIIKDGFAYIQAGAGIVSESIPEKEYEETLHKLKLFLEAQTVSSAETDKKLTV